MEESWTPTTPTYLPGETPTSAAGEVLGNEYGITERLDLHLLKGYAYENDYGDGSCENEFCLPAFTVYDGVVVADKGHVVKIVKIPAKEVVQSVMAEAGKLPGLAQGYGTGSQAGPGRKKVFHVS